MDSFMPRVARFEGNLVFILHPGTALAQGIVLTPDPTPGVPPNTFTFAGPYDGNEDGFNETTLSGRVTFNGDPDNFAVDWPGFSGQATVDVNIPVLGHVYHANVNFTMAGSSHQLSGTGTFFNPLTGNTTSMTGAGTPLVIRPATGAAGSVSNACGYSLDGEMAFEVTGPSGTLRATWTFSGNSAQVTVSGRTFTDTSGVVTPLPDTTVESHCGEGGTINDWAGTYDLRWACLPRESGSDTITITVTGPDTVTIDDEGEIYTARTIGGNPHALRGFFIDGPPGSQYREDFNWTMRKSLSGFSQTSQWVFIEGARIGSGGVCVASAPRL
jgi:hypothetical protein